MKILNQAQAEAVYSAMAALNNVSVRLVAEWEQVYDTGYYPARKEQFEVREQRDGSILVRILGCDGVTYANQAAFAAAYGLDADEPEMFKHLGLSFKVLAKFPADDTKAANAFMAANPNAGLLCIENGTAYLVDMADDGVVA